MSAAVSKKGPAAPASTAPPTGGPNPFASNPDAMAQMMKYLPLIMNVAGQAPGVLIGFFITILFFLLAVGRASFKESIAPISGFHILVFFLLRELYTPWKNGRQKAAVLREENDRRKNFANDIGMQYREKLD